MSGRSLRTGRLLLLPWSPDDVEDLLTLLNHPLVRRWLLDDATVERAWVENEVSASTARFATDGAGIWSLRSHRRPAHILGFCGFRPFFDPPRRQLLYGLRPDAWGRGYATEAAAAVLRHAADTLGWDRVEAATDAPNTASIRVLERIGMQPVPDCASGGPATRFFEWRDDAKS